MASARPPGGGSQVAARLSLDLSSFQRAPAVAREAARATEREISNAFKSLQAEQRLAQTQAQQTLAVLRAQQSQITATTRAESSVRIAATRAESAAQQQASRVAAATAIEEQRRLTATHRSELRAREQAARASQVSAGAFGRGAATFAGAALGGPIGGLVGAVAGGAPALAAGLAVSEGSRFAVQAGQIATAFDRQSLAAKNLAGSTSNLNEMLAAYTRASGGAVDKATALSNVTRLQAVGFGDNAAEVERFTVAVRGSSIAMGKLQDEISQEVQLAISNQSLRRLDQIGLGITEVNERIAELRASNAGMTREAAFQEAVLGLLIEKFGALAKSAEGQATGIERTTRAWRDLRLEIGQATQGPVGTAGFLLTARINQEIALLHAWMDTLSEAQRRADNLSDSSGLTALFAMMTGQNVTTVQAQRLSRIQQPELLPSAANQMTRPTRPGPRFTDPQIDIMVEREAALTQISRDSNRAIIDSERQFGQQRASTIAGYNKSIIREAEDFQRSRLNAERKHNFAILDVAQDSARQRVKWEQDLARNIAQAQADSVERVAEVREDSGERLAEIEAKFARDREKRERDHRDTLMDAAGRLDAKAVYEAQRNFARQETEAKEAHDEQRNDLKAQLQERLDQESDSLDKSIRQQQDAHQRRLDEQAENDRLRIQEMKDAFAEQIAQEDVERGIMLDRRLEDHNAALLEMERAQGERLIQMREQEAEALAEANKAYDLRLQAEGVHNAKLEAEQLRHQVIAEKNYAAHLDALDAIVKGRAQGAPEGPQPQHPMITPGGFPSLVPPVAPYNPAGSSSSVRTSSINIHPGAIVIQEATRLGQTKQEVWEAMIEFMEEASD